MRLELFNFPSFSDAHAAQAVDAKKAAAALPIEQELVEEADPSFSVQELEAAERTGFEKGYTQGYSSATQEIKNEIYTRDNNALAVLQQVKESIAGLTTSHARYLEEQKPAIARLAIGIAKKIAGEAVAQNPTAEIEPMITRCLQMLTDEPRISIHVHGSLLKAMEEKIEAVVAGNVFIGEIVVQEDKLLQPSDCRVEWKNGTAERNTEKMWKEIEEILLSASTPRKEAASGEEASVSKIYIANG